MTGFWEARLDSLLSPERRGGEPYPAPVRLDIPFPESARRALKAGLKDGL